MNDNLKIIMTKDFENWLKQADLFENYQNNPDQQQTIFIDYKREKEFIEKEFSEWMSGSPKSEWTDSDYLEMEVAIKKARESKIKKLDDELSSVNPSEAVAILDKLLYGLRRKELLTEVGAAFTDWGDWDDWHRKYLICAKNYHQKRLSIKPPKQKNRTTYQWQGNADKELPELYSLLVNEYNLIASDTTLEQFTDIFTGQSIDYIDPIKWSASKSLNAYFIERLISKNKLSKAINTDVWEISKSCFIDGTNFSQLIDNYNNSKTGKPRNYNLIDDLLNAL